MKFSIFVIIAFELIHCGISKSIIGNCELFFSTIIFNCCEECVKLDLTLNNITCTQSNATKTTLINYIEAIQFRNCTIESDLVKFEQFPMLEYINITKMGFQSLPEMKNLRTLDATKNKLTFLRRDNFRNSRNLWLLYLNENSISEIDEDAFDDLPHLFTLELSSNNLTHISNKLFSRVTNLCFLILSHNRIASIASNTFDYLSHLYRLDLSFNLIETLDVFTFASLTDLRFLDMAHNKLSTIKLQTFSTLNNSIELNLSSNALETFDFMLVPPNCQKLYMDNNHLIEFKLWNYPDFPIKQEWSIHGNHFYCNKLETFFNSHAGIISRERLVNNTSNIVDGNNVYGIKCYDEPIGVDKPFELLSANFKLKINGKIVEFTLNNPKIDFKVEGE